MCDRCTTWDLWNGDSFNLQHFQLFTLPWFAALLVSSVLPGEENNDRYFTFSLLLPAGVSVKNVQKLQIPAGMLKYSF